MGMSGVVRTIELTRLVGRRAMGAVKYTGVVFLVVSILLVPLTTALVRSSEGSTAIMYEREQRGLRGPVKSCIETRTFPGGTDGEGKKYPEFHSEYATEYDLDGRILATRSRNSDGSQWVTSYTYDAAGRLLKIGSGVEGQAGNEITYSYDQRGRLQNINDSARPENPVTFRYDEFGRKSTIETSRPADYRPSMASGGTPFEAAAGQRIYRVEEARPPFMTNMTGPRKSKCMMPTVTW